MKKLYKWFSALPAQGKMFNIVAALSMAGALFGLFSTVLQASSLISGVSVGALVVGIFVLFLGVNHTRRWLVGEILMTAVLCCIGFPFIFFSSGGIYSGMLAYLVMGVAIIALLLEGRAFTVMLSTYIAVCVGSIVVSYLRPELVTPINNEKMIFVDVATSFTAASILVSLIFKYHIREQQRVRALLEAERERAEAASRSKSDFLSNMSHEMRTPMNAIIGMATIAKDTRDNDRRDYCLDKIDEASTHLLGVINDILDMSKIEANKFELSQVSFNFEKLVRKVETVLSFRVEEKHQTLEVELDPNVPAALIGDDQRLAQVITNLLTNAVKFTPEDGKITVASKLLEDEDGVCMVRVAVTDTGIGITDEQKDRLFTAFEQADNNTSRKFGGTGLGLAISKRIVEMMGGFIRIDSVIGLGSTFAFTFRAARDFSATEESAPADEGDADFSGRRILLAEDVDINREIVLAVLEPTNAVIDCAENGAEAVRLFTGNAGGYDAIFMDIQMPEMDGYEATRNIRASAFPNAKTIPIIAMTANVFREDVEKCLEAGMNDHVGKPLNFTEVIGKLRQYLPDD
ncbi:MAG: response regulator [Oscillospiraceae bacterium]|jgi:signal transduction histidine kinase|nr:response regulator [Oscillospiraceae bacterium]